MYVYQITNNINGKLYIGITNNPKTRWSNHRCCKTSVIGKAIQKYGAENFTFEVLKSGLSIEEAEAIEIKFIQEKKTLVSENGYNVAKGGFYNTQGLDSTTKQGENNGRHILTEEEVKYIKSHRDIPLYVLYDEFCDKISYSTFSAIYNDHSWKHIIPTVERYPLNLEFSCQFTNPLFEYDEIIQLRKWFLEGIPMGVAYERMGKRGSYENFSNVYSGKRYRLVMPEVFTEENKKRVSCNAHKGEFNGRAKLTAEDVKAIRRRSEIDHERPTNIHKDYPQVSITAIKNVINYKTWKNV